MQEPDWDELAERLSKLTLKQIRVVTNRWFAGCMGGESTKADIVREMVSQMRHLYHMEDGYGIARLTNIFNTISKLDGGWAPEREYAYYAIEYRKESSNG